MSRRWSVATTSTAAGILAAVLALLHNFSLALGGMVTGFAFWGRIAGAALLAAGVAAAVVALRNVLVRRA